jgi:dolichol-phosphate mannosyltransferase
MSSTSLNSALSEKPVDARGESYAPDSKIQILVPVYNEGENVTKLYRELLHTEVPFDSLTFIYDFDGESSLPFIERMSCSDQRVRADKNEFGRGVVNAFRWGFSRCSSGPVLVLMGDNSDKLSIIPEMIQLWQEGATIVAPSRYMPGGKQHGGPPLKTFLSRTAGIFLKFCGFPTADATNNFKLYDGQWVSRQQVESGGGFEIALELCYKAYRDGRQIVELPTEWWDRTMGESRFKMWSWIPRYLHWYFRALGLVARNHVCGC